MQFIFMYISIFSILIPIGAGLWRRSRLEPEIKWLLYMLIIVAANQFTSVWWVFNVEPNNLPFYHTYFLIELLFISRIYYLILENKKLRTIIIGIASSFVLFYLYRLVFDISYFRTYSTYMRAFEGIAIIFYTFSYFIQVYKKQEILALQKAAGFWLGSGLIIYFTSNLAIYLFGEFVFAQDSPIFESIMAVHAVLTILLYISYTIAMLCKKTETKS